MNHGQLLHGIQLPHMLHLGNQLLHTLLHGRLLKKFLPIGLKKLAHNGLASKLLQPHQFQHGLSQKFPLYHTQLNHGKATTLMIFQLQHGLQLGNQPLSQNGRPRLNHGTHTPHLGKQLQPNGNQTAMIDNH